MRLNKTKRKSKKKLTKKSEQNKIYKNGNKMKLLVMSVDNEKGLGKGYAGKNPSLRSDSECLWGTFGDTKKDKKEWK